jgi:hypothetical protein
VVDWKQVQIEDQRHPYCQLAPKHESFFHDQPHAGWVLCRTQRKKGFPSSVRSVITSSGLTLIPTELLEGGGPKSKRKERSPRNTRNTRRGRRNWSPANREAALIRGKNNLCSAFSFRVFSVFRGHFFCFQVRVDSSSLAVQFCWFVHASRFNVRAMLVGYCPAVRLSLDKQSVSRKLRPWGHG